MELQDIKVGMPVRARVSFGPTWIHMDGRVESINEEYGFVTLDNNKGWATFDNIWSLEEERRGKGNGSRQGGVAKHPGRVLPYQSPTKP